MAKLSVIEPKVWPDRVRLTTPEFYELRKNGLSVLKGRKHFRTVDAVRNSGIGYELLDACDVSRLPELTTLMLLSRNVPEAATRLDMLCGPGGFDFPINGEAIEEYSKILLLCFSAEKEAEKINPTMHGLVKGQVELCLDHIETDFDMSIENHSVLSWGWSRGETGNSGRSSFRTNLSFFRTIRKYGTLLNYHFEEFGHHWMPGENLELSSKEIMVKDLPYSDRKGIRPPLTELAEPLLILEANLEKQNKGAILHPYRPDSKFVLSVSRPALMERFRDGILLPWVDNDSGEPIEIGKSLLPCVMQYTVAYDWSIPRMEPPDTKKFDCELLLATFRQCCIQAEWPLRVDPDIDKTIMYTCLRYRSILVHFKARPRLKRLGPFGQEVEPPEEIKAKAFDQGGPGSRYRTKSLPIEI